MDRGTLQTAPFRNTALQGDPHNYEGRRIAKQKVHRQCSFKCDKAEIKRGVETVATDGQPRGLCDTQ